MREFQLVAQGIDTLPLMLELYRQPDLWNQHRERTWEGSPFYGTDDIWCRFRPHEELTSAASFAEVHIPTFYPAWHRLPHLRPLVFGLMAKLEAVQLGAVLITRVPPGEQVAPHDDRGRWHPEFFATKAYLTLASNAHCYNTCADERIVMQVGDVWLFDNLKTHSTVNEGVTDRITLIVSMRVES